MHDGKLFHDKSLVSVVAHTHSHLYVKSDDPLTKNSVVPRKVILVFEFDDIALERHL